jgi:putative transferase (TIGR04331 family)
VTLLATTALEWTWGDGCPVVFLGEWCRRYERSAQWGAREHTVVRNHWDDRAKLRKDHDYLNKLHDEILDDLASTLGRVHRIERSRKFWRTLVDPWLTRYLGVAFDRWETLRTAFEEHGISETFVRAASPRAAPYGHLEFADLTVNDDWNHDFFADILRHQYEGRCVMHVSQRPSIAESAPIGSSRRDLMRALKRQAMLRIDQVAGCLSRRNQILFVQSYFPFPALVALSLRLRQVPSLYLNEFEWPKPRVQRHQGSDSGFRQTIALRREPQNPFEAFLYSRIQVDLLEVFVESFAAMRRQANAIKLRPTVVFTATAHWFNDFFKQWIAERVHEGTLLVTMDHGGSLHPRFGVMGFEEDIADVKTTWTLPYHPRHIRLPSNKFAGRRRKLPRGAHLVVIGSEMPRYAFAAWSGPIAGQTLVGFEHVCRLYEALGAAPRRAFLIKPYPEQGWALRQRFIERLGSDKVMSKRRLEDVMGSARMIVCTYPQTTFSDAMACGAPSVLVYPRHLWETVPLFDGLIETLHKAQIVFFDPQAAAEHINAVWDDPNAWWQSPLARAARSRFEAGALDLRRDWIEPWVEFARQMAASAAVERCLTKAGQG